MATTIQISDELKDELSGKKLFQKETYEEVIWAILQDIRDIDQQTQKEIEAARIEIREGRYYTLGDARSITK